MTTSLTSSSQPRGMAAALNAIRNASRIPVGSADIEKMLSAGRGDGSQLRALFGDVSLDTLTWLAIAFGIDQRQLLAAYATARAEAAAANPELDALLP